ncbi:alpha/beta hydrolase [Microbacterium sp. SLBN-146]|uniref:alpha/beta hydrolase n=1 Tax=Microbacterium sp. SLBN-146 TaxID=2768457 RepID=UPI0011528CD5|nr:lysophospholipase [Microbacterium sp. SLBN-146]TQJ29856.1 hypothetical protein FBY39_0299 [Microbacterium sp. SLBN-146]
MTSTALVAPALWSPPPSVRVRGTLAVVAGSGETTRVYERLGRRLAGDGYLVGVFETDAANDAAAWLAAQQVEPRVLVGSDSGAAAVLVRADGADGVVVAGLPVAGAAGGSAEERTACPVHLGVLSEATVDAAGTDAVEIPDAATLAAIAVPVLAFHGGADPIAPFAQAAAVLEVIPELELVETVDGLHDALNDQTHRSVAARIVLWLERLRGAGVRHPLVRDARVQEDS